MLATLASEQKAKGEHFYTLDLQAFSFMSLEGGGQEMSVRVYMCVHTYVCDSAATIIAAISSRMRTEESVLPPHTR